ncbi:hypothetical protein DNTS_000316 [Danionella cerebrum]|uniref:Proheparin-binding EGF-like growth factor n=1 Tax=Danionella cerebrum TaxID=2873325 RepID=A0A553R5Q4_9TELE|nr:hypothetical protein DNTS_000316 [Danionella translucida]
MNTLRLGRCVYFLVLLSMRTGASVDRYESAKPGTTLSPFHSPVTTNITSGGLHLDNGTSVEQVEEVDYEEYFDLSGDFEINHPKVAFSTRPKDPSALPTTEKRKERRKGKGKGKGRKKNPCLKEFKDFCIHGACHYLRELRTHSCVCHGGYSGERCHIFTLPVGKEEQRYSRTTALAVIAVVLSLMCLAVIAILLALRYHKKDDTEVEREEKVKLEATSVIMIISNPGSPFVCSWCPPALVTVCTGMNGV